MGGRHRGRGGRLDRQHDPRPPRRGRAVPATSRSSSEVAPPTRGSSSSSRRSASRSSRAAARACSTSPRPRVLGADLRAGSSDIEWRERYGPREADRQRPACSTSTRSVFNLDDPQRAATATASCARGRRTPVPSDDRTADLVGEFYELLGELGVRDWDLADPLAVNRLGTLARFSSLLADYESVRRRARPDADVAGEQVGGQDRGPGTTEPRLHIINYAQGAYEGFDGEDDFALDAVDLTTIHRAKGLEWPVVFVPSLTANRFPSSNDRDGSRTGSCRATAFDAARYEGSDADERRLFYVAITRARDWLSLSRHEQVTKQAVGPSPYLTRARPISRSTARRSSTCPDVEADGASRRADRADVQRARGIPRLRHGLPAARTCIGFQPRLAPELGYGKAVHHLMRAVAEDTQATGVVPTPRRDRRDPRRELLPADRQQAGAPAAEGGRAPAGRHATSTEHPDDLHRVWETERPFELHLDGVTVSGRADVILDQEAESTALAIVDYKTSVHGGPEDHALQLQVYADAGRREGLDVRGAYVHDLKAGVRLPRSISATRR